MKIEKYIFLILAVVLSVGISVYINQPQSVYIVNIEEVRAGFLMQEDVEQDFEKIQNGQQSLLDSLEMQIRNITNEISTASKPDKDKEALLNKYRLEYRDKSVYFQTKQGEIIDNLNSKIWNRLDEYLNAFRAEMNYPVLICTNGYTYLEDNSKIVTDQALNFVNKAYNNEDN